MNQLGCDVISQDNVLVNRCGCPCLCDSGLSQMLADNSLWNTSATSAMGTMRWQSPELLSGGQPMVTVVSDIYAYAITCYVSDTSIMTFATHLHPGENDKSHS